MSFLPQPSKCFWICSVVNFGRKLKFFVQTKPFSSLEILLWDAIFDEIVYPIETTWPGREYGLKWNQVIDFSGKNIRHVDPPANPFAAAAVTWTKLLTWKKENLSSFNSLLLNFDWNFETTDENIVTEFQSVPTILAGNYKGRCKDYLYNKAVKTYVFSIA